MRFPDMEQVAQDLCQRVCESYKFLPVNLESLLSAGPVCLVERVGGVSDGVTDRALVSVSVWASTRAQAWATARDLEELFHEFDRGGVVGSVWVDQIVPDVGGQQIATEDPDERRVTSVYRFDVRRQ